MRCSTLMSTRVLGTVHITRFKGSVMWLMLNLIDLGYNGHFWTWEKKIAGGTFMRVRLDT
jgi:hypothetical protein